MVNVNIIACDKIMTIYAVFVTSFRRFEAEAFRKQAKAIDAQRKHDSLKQINLLFSNVAYQNNNQLMELPLKTLAKLKPPPPRPYTSRSNSQTNSYFHLENGIKRIEEYQYEQQNVLGQGYSSKVYLGHAVADKEQLYAIKVVDKRRLSKDILHLLTQQIEIHKQLSHPNIVKCHDVIERGCFYYFILEYCPHGTLQKFIKKHQQLVESTTIAIMQQILAAYRYLLQFKIIHRDLKPPNILRVGNTWKICDFGFSIMGKKQFAGDINVGTPAYMAPEALTRSFYSFKTDIFSLGVICYQMLFGVTPWQHKNQSFLLRMMQQIPLSEDKLSGLSNKQLSVFIRKCCEPLERKRMGIADLEQFTFWLQQEEEDQTKEVRVEGKQSRLLENKLEPNQLVKTASSQVSSCSGVKITSREMTFQQNCYIIEKEIYFARLLFALLWHYHQMFVYEDDKKQMLFAVFSKHAQHILRRIRQSNVNYLNLQKWQQFSQGEQFAGYHDESQRLIKQINHLVDQEIKRKTIIIIRQFNKKYDELTYDKNINLKCVNYLQNYAKQLLNNCYREYYSREGEKVSTDHRRVLQSLLAYCEYLKQLAQDCESEKKQVNRKRQYREGGTLLEEQRPRTIAVLSEHIRAYSI